MKKERPYPDMDYLYLMQQEESIRGLSRNRSEHVSHSVIYPTFFKEI